MTDMDEIRELLSEYADAVFDRGAASGASNEVYPPNAGETSSRSALLQRVEALREERGAAAAQSFSGHDWNRLLNERDAARASQKRAEEERDAAESRAHAEDRAWLVGAPHSDPKECPSFYDGCHCTVGTLAFNVARAEKAESALAALRAAPEGSRCKTCGDTGLRLEPGEEVKTYCDCPIGVAFGSAWTEDEEGVVEAIEGMLAFLRAPSSPASAPSPDSNTIEELLAKPTLTGHEGQLRAALAWCHARLRAPSPTSTDPEEILP